GADMGQAVEHHRDDAHPAQHAPWVHRRLPRDPPRTVAFPGATTTTLHVTALVAVTDDSPAWWMRCPVGRRSRAGLGCPPGGGRACPVGRGFPGGWGARPGELSGWTGVRPGGGSGRGGQLVGGVRRRCWVFFAASYVLLAVWPGSVVETSATGTSHQASEDGPSMAGSVRTYTTVTPLEARAVSSALRSSSAEPGRSTVAPRLAALAARSTGSGPPS